MVSVDLQLFITCSPNIEVNDEDIILMIACPNRCSPNIEVNDEDIILMIACPNRCSPNIEVNDVDNSLRLGCPHRTRLDESIYTFVPFGCFGKNVSH